MKNIMKLLMGSFIWALLSTSMSHGSAPATWESLAQTAQILLRQTDAQMVKLADLKEKMTRAMIKNNPDLYINGEHKTIDVKGQMYPKIPTYLDSASSHPVALKHYLDQDPYNVEATRTKDHASLLMHVIQNNADCQIIESDEEQYTNLVNTVLAYHPDVNRKAKYGRTALYFALISPETGSYTIMKELLARGAQANLSYTNKYVQGEMYEDPSPVTYDHHHQPFGFCSCNKGGICVRYKTQIEHPTLHDLAKKAVNDPYFQVYLFQSPSAPKEKLALLEEYLSKQS